MKYVFFLMLSVSGLASDVVLKRAARFVIGKNEGVSYTVYLDINGHKTIGVGHRLGANESFERIGKKEVAELFDKDIEEHLARCRRSLSNFDSYPVQVQVAILDGFYRGCLSGSPKALALLRSGKFVEASKEYLNHRGYRRSKREGTGVYKRMDRNALVLLRYGQKLRGNL